MGKSEDTRPLLANEGEHHEYPWNMKTLIPKIVSVGIIMACCTIASGPLGGLPTLEPLLIKIGVFKTQQSLYSAVNQPISFHCINVVSVIYDLCGYERTFCFTNRIFV
jgi:hypothetical protein